MKFTEYVVESGVALYIGESWEITESFTDTPFAPKTKVEKSFDAGGETSSTTYVNDVNSPNDWAWNWVEVL